MAKTLHPKILEARNRSPFMMRSAPEAQVAKPEDFLTLLDQRIVRGYSSLWETKNSYGEKFVRGAWKKSINDRGPASTSVQPIKFFRQHNQADVLSKLEVLEERDLGLYFETKPLDPVDSADRVLIQLRSGSLNNYSNGFLPVWDKAEYDEQTDTIWYKEANLFEISVVGLASDDTTFTVRSLEEFSEQELLMTDDIEYFIKSLQRKDQLEARFLFARQKSLYEVKPVKLLENEIKPTTRSKKINIKFLNENL